MKRMLRYGLGLPIAVMGMLLLSCGIARAQVGQGATGPLITSLTQRGANVKDAAFGALGTATVYPAGAGTGITTSAGTSTLSGAIVTGIGAAGVGTVISVPGAGNDGSLTITSSTAATPPVITFTYTGTRTVAAMSGMHIFVSGATGTAASLNGDRFLQGATGAGTAITYNAMTSVYTATLYTDTATTAVVGGTYAGSPVAVTPCTLWGTISSYNVGAATFTLTGGNVAGASLTNVSFIIGYDDTAAIQTALNAGGHIVMPAGTFLTTGTLFIKKSGTKLVGAGRANTFICAANDVSSSILSAQTPTGGISDVQIADLSITIMTLPVQRYISSSGMYFVGSAANPLQHWTIENCGVTNTLLGTCFRDAAWDCKVIHNYVGPTVADGIANYGIASPCLRISVIGNHVRNTGDDAISDNSYSTSSGPNHGMVITGNTVLNAGAGCIATCGSDQTIISNNICQNSYLAAIRCQGDYGFYPVVNTSVIGNQISGAGRATRTAYSAAIGSVGGIQVQNSSSVCSNLVIADNQIGADNGNTSMGPAILLSCGTAATTGVMNNHVITGNRLTGPFANAPGDTYRTNAAYNGAAIYVNNGYGCILTNNSITSPYGEGIYLGAACTLAQQIVGNLIDTPNNSATANYYAIDVMGGTSLNITNNNITNVGTLANAVNLTPINASWKISNNQFGVLANTYAQAQFAADTYPGTISSATYAAGTVTTPTGGFAYTVLSGSVSSAPGVLTFGTTSSVVTIATGKHDCDASITVGGTSVQSVGILLAADAAKNGISVTAGGLITLVGGGGASFVVVCPSAPVALQCAAGDTLHAILNGGWVEAWRVHSGAWTLMGSAVVPVSFTGTNVGLNSSNVGATIAAVSIGG